MEFMPDLPEISAMLATIFKKGDICNTFICYLKFNFKNHLFGNWVFVCRCDQLKSTLLTVNYYYMLTYKFSGCEQLE